MPHFLKVLEMTRDLFCYLSSMLWTILTCCAFVIINYIHKHIFSETCLKETSKTYKLATEKLKFKIFISHILNHNNTVVQTDLRTFSFSVRCSTPDLMSSSVLLVFSSWLCDSSLRFCSAAMCSSYSSNKRLPLQCHQCIRYNITAYAGQQGSITSTHSWAATATKITRTLRIINWRLVDR